MPTYTFKLTKGGHPQFKSAPLQLRTIADNKIDCGIAEYQKLWNCDCGPSKLTSAILQLSAVSCQLSYFLVSFPQLRMVLKINLTYY
jgi:hypothetical protein